jgi:hypothetical protein
MEDFQNTCNVLGPLNLPAWFHFVFNLGKFAAVKLVFWDDVTWGPVKGVLHILCTPLSTTLQNAGTVPTQFAASPVNLPFRTQKIRFIELKY